MSAEQNRKRKSTRKCPRRKNSSPPRNKPAPPPESQSPESQSPESQSPKPHIFGATSHEFDSADESWDENLPFARAQQLVYEASETKGQGRVELARRALTICPDCTDAYVLLAEQAAELEQAIELYGQGIAAGRRLLGGDKFRQYEGMFWTVPDTRPYMRAKLGLAQCLRFAGRENEAADHLQEMLRLNPMDNQGVRWILASCLLDLGRNDQLGRLLAEYSEDGTATWAYTKALLTFRQGGDTPRVRQLLAKAVRSNKHVPDYLLGDVSMPRQVPEYFTPGDDAEAVLYALDFLSGWKATPGAISWLRKATRVTVPKPVARKSRRPPAANQDLLDLPQSEHEVWQADVLRLPTWVEVDGESVRPWIVLVTDSSNDLVLAHDMSDRQPPAETLWDKLCKAMRSPLVGSAHRPGEVHLRSEDHRSAAGDYLEAISVRCIVSDRLEQLDFVFDSLSKQMCPEESIPALIEVPGVELKQVGAYFEAAADFFQQAPWRQVPSDTPIKVECDKFDSGPWYAVVMGQSGVTLGLALYDDFAALQSLLSGQCGSEEAQRHASAVSVTFDEEFTMAVADLEAAEQFGWPVATPEAYPCAMRLNPGRAIRPPLAWELELLEGCLRAIPEFLAGNEGTSQRISVPVASGVLELLISSPC